MVVIIRRITIEYKEEQRKKANTKRDPFAIVSAHITHQRRRGFLEHSCRRCLCLVTSGDVRVKIIGVPGKGTGTGTDAFSYDESAHHHPSNSRSNVVSHQTPHAFPYNIYTVFKQQKSWKVVLSFTW
jgi:hypothetical protein